jgi:hypothetical protein
MRVRRSRAILAIALGLLVVLGLATLYFLYDYGFFAEPDRSILTDEPCAAPCWQGIVPSQTTEEEAIRILENNPFVSGHDVGCVRSEFRETVCSWRARHWRGGSNHLYIREGVVQLMYITPKINLTLGQVVGKYGSPEKVHTDIGGRERLVYCFHLYYPSKGLVFISQTPIESGEKEVSGEKEASVTEDWTVSSIDYFAPTSLEGYLEALTPDLSVEDWHGFGVYDFSMH